MDFLVTLSQQNPTLATLLAVLGMLGVTLSGLGATLPKGWAFTRWAARIGADIRGLHIGEPNATTKRTGEP